MLLPVLDAAAQVWRPPGAQEWREQKYLEVGTAAAADVIEKDARQRQELAKLVESSPCHSSGAVEAYKRLQEKFRSIESTSGELKTQRARLVSLIPYCSAPKRLLPPGHT